MQGIKIGKEETKRSSFIDNMIVYRGNLKESIDYLCESISRCNRAAGYKVKKQKSFVFLFTSNKQNEIFKKMPLTMSFLTINLTDDV